MQEIENHLIFDLFLVKHTPEAIIFFSNANILTDWKITPNSKINSTIELNSCTYKYLGRLIYEDPKDFTAEVFDEWEMSHYYNDLNYPLISPLNAPKQNITCRLLFYTKIG